MALVEVAVAMPIPRRSTVTFLLCAAASFATACAASKPGDPVDGPPTGGIDDEDDGSGGRSAENLSGSLPVGSVVRTTAALNFRRSPTKSAEILDVIPKGDTATITEKYPDTGFYHLHWKGMDGWSSGAYLSLVSSGGGGAGGDTGGGGSSGGTADGDGVPGSKPASAWSCSGSYATTPTTSKNYVITAFGCWVDAAGVAHGDSGDNCIPGCLSKAKSSGLCKSGDTGKRCEERVTWFVADAGRFGCLTNVKLTNPKNGKAVIAVVLDYGPACWVERKVSRGVLDASGRVNRYLFGEDHGVGDGVNVVVEAAPPGAKLGPI